MAQDEQDGQAQEAKPQGKEPDYKALYEEWKDHSRKWEERSKANEQKAKEYDKLKEEQMSETERLKKQLADATAERDAFKAEHDLSVWTQEASEETGVPASVLRGSTKDEVMAHAEALSPYFKTDSAPVVQSDGFSPDGGAKETTARQFASALDEIF